MLRVVLDSNEFVFGFRGVSEPNKILRLAGVKFECIIPQLILEEVIRNLKHREGKDFASFVRDTILRMDMDVLDESGIPHTLIEKYVSKGLKPADALIAAFTEWVNADLLISENRHLVRELKPEGFKVLQAKDFIRVLEESASR